MHAYKGDVLPDHSVIENYRMFRFGQLGVGVEFLPVDTFGMTPRPLRSLAE